MKKYIITILSIVFITACSPKDTTTEKTKEANSSLDKNTVFSFDVNKLKIGCDYSSELVCIINYAIKCTLNPNFEECKKIKNKIPSFVFMNDESLQRPTFQSYKINKLTPREDGAIEVYTQSSCNGNWFGLCNGNIVYVMKNIDSEWYIKDIYSIEF